MLNVEAHFLSLASKWCDIVGTVEASLLEQIPEPIREKVARVFQEREQFFSVEEGRLKQQILLLRELVRLFHIDKFGVSSEKLTDAQLALLNLEPSVTQGEVEAEAALPEVDKQALTEPPLQERKPAQKPKRKSPVRQSFAPELPRREKIIECARVSAAARPAAGRLA
jgi:hypothetical protein